MAKKVTLLTENELKQLIKDATARVMNDMNAPTYSRIHNADALEPRAQACGLL